METGRAWSGQCTRGVEASFRAGHGALVKQTFPRENGGRESKQGERGRSVTQRSFLLEFWWGHTLATNTVSW